ncbi:hypothetical protein L1N85_11250 [Paenibacillus alkaliterrae]|uniref:hypothetical protein n=1 Tax=Paenibacillus alkaliterrae TaxID=320909 RepID=UPI001F1ADB26|nr:hypothetical protein [Paenibacillus alkaliterrae]MCF2939013.1 hypothetical protein [Paenibacillus alkaliterrae]
MSSATQARDLESDLEYVDSCSTLFLAAGYHFSFPGFIKNALIGWPYAIKRAMEAEKEVDRLRNELNILQEQKRGRGCWD